MSLTNTRRVERQKPPPAIYKLQIPARASSIQARTRAVGTYQFCLSLYYNYIHTIAAGKKKQEDKEKKNWNPDQPTLTRRHDMCSFPAPAAPSKRHGRALELYKKDGSFDREL